MRKEHGLTQEDLAAKAGVGLRFVRELEQGKQTLRMDKVNQVLGLFGHEIGAVPISNVFVKLDEQSSNSFENSAMARKGRQS